MFCAAVATWTSTWGDSTEQGNLTDTGKPCAVKVARTVWEGAFGKVATKWLTRRVPTSPLGSEVGRPVLILDVGSLMGSLVGLSEERTRHALRTIDAMAPCVVMIDEVEKAFAGVNGNSDSGVSSRMFATFLSWLNDHESDVFVVCTANDVSKLPPEFARSERFDAVFFLDLPTREEKDAIWDIYLNLFEIAPDQRRPDDANFTGAEIRACCRLAALLDVSLVQAAQNVVPVAVTAAESVERLRTWASGRCLDASQPGIYQCNGGKGKSRRRVSRDPSNN